NLLRVLVGKTEETEETEEDGATEEKNVVLVETNLDDCNPQFLERAMERLFEAGALDVAFHPVVMKKNRPGVMLSAVVPPSCQEACAQIVLEETTALGVRLLPAERRVMKRKIETVETPYGAVRVKSASREKARNRMPEYEDCLRAAREHGVPVKEVWIKALVPPSQPESGSSGSMEGCDS
ncbi:MAG: nickel insertion protein, partial [Bacteroidota bacterium]